MNNSPFCQREAGRVYLDHNATSPLSQSVVEALPRWIQSFGNPSSIHWTGREPKALLREARGQLATALGISPLEIVFTSGGTEADNLAIRGVAEKALFGPGASLRRKIIVSAVEHPAVLKSVRQLKSWGFSIVEVPVTREGVFDMEALAANLDEQTLLVSVMFANNETGHIFPVKKIAKLAHQFGAIVHCDGVQALGKVLFSPKDLGVDLMSFSGHKFYAMKGSGFLFVRSGLELNTQLTGGGQERHRRGGTENVIAQASLGLNVLKFSELPDRIAKMETLRNRLESGILAELADVEICGLNSKRLVNTSNATIAGVDGESLLMNLDMRGFSVSTGAACSSGNPEPSPVLLAMGYSRREAQSSLRVSLGWGTESADVDQFLTTLIDVVGRLRNLNPREREAHAANL